MRLEFFLSLFFLFGAAPWAAAIDFNWQELFVPPNPNPFYDGNWSDVDHWDHGTFIPSTASDTASIALAGVPDYVVTMDLDTHIGAFSLDSPDATLVGVNRVFRVDGVNDLLQGTIEWDNSQILDSGAGTLTNEATATFTRTTLIDTATVVQHGTFNVVADASSARLTVTNGIFSNRGLINVSTSTGATATLRMTSGALVNDAGGGLAGELRFGGAGSGERRFEGDLENAAFVNVFSDMTFSGAGDIVTNSGPFFIAPGVTVKMQTGGQTFNHNGNDLNVQGAFEGTFLTFNFNGGTVSSNALSLVASGLNIGAGASNGAFVLQGGSTYSGDLKAVHSVTLLSAATNTTVTAANGFSNNGVLAVQSTGGGQALLSVTSGTVVNQSAGVIDFLGTTGTRVFNGDLTNGGTINVDGNTSFGKIGGIVTNTGQFTIASGATFTSGISQVWNQDGGTLDVQGSFDPTFLTLNYNGGEISGNPMTMTQSTLNMGVGSGDGEFFLRGGSAYSGDLQVGQVVTVLSDTINTTVTAANGFNNNGALALQSTGTGLAILSVTTGALVNQSTGVIDFLGTTGTRRYDGDLTNNGTLNVSGNASFGRSGSTVANAGTINIAVGATLLMNVGGGQIFNQDAGTLDVQGVFGVDFATFNHNGGDITGTPITVTLGTLNIGPGAGTGSFVLRRSSSYSGDLQAGQQVTVLGDSQNAVVIAASGFSNSGVLNIQSGPGSSRLDVNGGPLVNQAAGVLNFSGTAFMELRAELNNQGTVNVDDDASIGTTAKNHLNSGEIVASATATFLGTSFTNQAGGLISGGGELNVSGLSFQNGGEIAPGTSIGDLLITGNAPFGGTSLLSIELGGTNPGTEYDQLLIAGTTTLAGLLSVDLIDSFIPLSTHTFTVLTATSLGGSFSNVLDGARLTTVAGTGSFLVNYDGLSNVVVLSDFQPTLAGDFDLDNDVDGLDFLAWQIDPNVGDLSDWEANFGTVITPLTAASSAVPEPATSLLALAALSVASIKRRR